MTYHPLGPVMLGIEGHALTPADVERLLDPLVGGVILFARNYDSPEQLGELTSAIRVLRKPELLIAVDHEGGRVQRFRDGFTQVPPMRTLGELYDQDPWAALREAQRIGWLIASELRPRGIDFSFTPVLDLDHGGSAVIGDRALHRKPDVVAELAVALRRGLNEGGMPAVAKHFPGHGFVTADSHVALPVDRRTLEQLKQEDLLPFARLVDDGVEAIMPAHVVYEQVDAAPAGFSSRWVSGILRGELNFDGLVVSDDLDMAGAHAAGDIVARATAATDAGCDMVLVCNDLDAANILLSQWRPTIGPQLARRTAAMHGRAVGPPPY
ncbi:MAG TPA: beta-N-acetylhexosaminidase [Casimicrobiaceae bacterium]|nr:beta-N-acetylhexosaminidase [Casimicrobiaceae bacterium]